MDVGAEAVTDTEVDTEVDMEAFVGQHIIDPHLYHHQYIMVSNNAKAIIARTTEQQYRIIGTKIHCADPLLLEQVWIRSHTRSPPVMWRV